MKKTMALGITALTIAAACTPVAAQAAGTQGSLKNSGSNPGSQFQKIVITQDALNCDQNSWENILNGLGDLKLPADCLKPGTIIWNGNCPELPELPGIPGKPEIPGLPGTPELPETPEVPDVPTVPEKPELPESPEVPETPETPEKPETPGESVSFAKRVVELVNIERAKEGLAPLAIDEKMESAARVRAKEIQSNFSHTRPNGSSFSTALKEAGVTYMRSGENIAWGQRSPEEVVRGWMNSPSHRANIMNGSFSRIGVGHLQNGAGTSYWVQLFAN